MNSLPLKWCKFGGCRNTTSNASGYCDTHAAHAPRAEYDRQRKEWQKWYASARYRRDRAYWFANIWSAPPPVGNLGLCAMCNRAPATDLDHKIPHRGNADLFWAASNWQGLCHPCHSEKTAREDSGFGNQPRQAKGAK